ncbi:MAG: D-aminoacylase [archaeon]
MPAKFDYVVRKGRIIDGCGNPWFRADVGIRKDRIARIGRIGLSEARYEIDASKMIVCPGFIDPHSHSDMSLIFDSRAESTIHQGITTLVVGQCGISLAPINPQFEHLLRSYLSPFLPKTDVSLDWTTFSQYITKMKQIRSTTNTVHLVGHGTIRIAAMGFEDREPTRRELERMKNMVSEAMSSGAVGMSTGLIYPPGVFCKTDELIQLTKVVAAYGGRYFSHIRGEGVTLITAVKEVIEIGEKTGAPVHISHHKAAGRTAWGKTKETLELMEDARARGVEISYDQYPYTAGMTSLVTLLPPWMHEGGMDKLLARLRDPESVDKARRELQREHDHENMIAEAGWDKIFVASVKTRKNKQLEGKSIAEISRLLNKKDEYTTLSDLLLEEKGEATMIIFSMDEEDVQYAMKGRYQTVGTDAWSTSTEGILSKGKPHPRFFGTYPRILGKYVREKGLLTLEDAIRRMTSFPAITAGLADRGILKEGFYADLVVFDSERIVDNATFEDPKQFPQGIKTVLVNGQIVVESGRLTKKRPGRVLHRAR